MIAVFERAPTARVVMSPICYYQGVDHFYAMVRVRSMLLPRHFACSCREFYDNPQEALVPDVRISGDWRAGKKLYQGLEQMCP